MTKTCETDIKSYLKHISKMTNILLSAPKDEVLKKTYQHNLLEFSKLLLEGQDGEHNCIDDILYNDQRD